MNSSPRRPRPVNSSSPPQFALKDLLIFTAAVGILFALLRCLNISLGGLLHLSLIFGGLATVMIALLELSRPR